ncbi:MAG: TonB-dependent receptor family protein [Jejuia sp.]
MKKTKYLTPLLFLIFIQLNHSQNKIVDAKNNNLLVNISVENIESGTLQFSTDGLFEISKTGSYQFTKEGYFTKKLKLNKNESYVIQLIKQPSKLNEVVVFSNYIPIEVKASTSSVGLITASDIERGNTINLNESINRVPGVFMQTGALNTNRITIRGVGSRNLFGTSKIRAYYNNIPLTNGSGETSLEDFELGAISRVEIIKGATSSIYGAGLGGVIQLIPKQASNKSTLANEVTTGTFGLIKYLSQFGYSNQKSNIKLAYSITGSDGYRDNNEYKRQTITLNTSHQLSSKSEISILGLFSDLKAFIPSSLNVNDFRDNPESAAFTWRTSQGFEDTKRGIFGMSLKHKFNTKFAQNTSLFTSFRNSFEPRPFNILEEKELGYGLRHTYSGNFKIQEKPIKWIVGLEFFKDEYKYQTFENLYRDFPSGTVSIQGENLSNFKEKRQYYNVFIESRYGISQKTELVLGANFNKTSYNLEDRFPVSTENLNESGIFKFKGILSPKLGILQKLNKNSNIYANISHGFSPLSLQEVLLPDGQINNNLNPETGWNFEIGVSGSAFQQKLSYTISAYRLSIKNLLVARRTSQDEFIGINAGRTHHDGIEADIDYRILSSNSVQLSLFGSYVFNNYKFKDFVDGDNDFSGNKLTGVPSDVLNLGLDFNTAFGFYGNFNYQYIGQMPITDSNNIFSESYNISNCKFGYKTRLGNTLNFNIFFGVNNIFDEVYASQILINAQGFGGNLPRYYYPGNPINYYSALSLNYRF